MSKNLTRKGMALVSGSALVLTSLVGVAAPATAAPGDSVKLAPQSGTGYNVFVQDTLKVKATIDATTVNSASYDDLHWKIAGIDSVTASINVTPSTVNVTFVDPNGTPSSGDELCRATVGYETYDANDQLVASGTLIVDSGAAATSRADLDACVTYATTASSNDYSTAAVAIPIASNVSYAVLLSGAYNISLSASDNLTAVGTDNVNELSISLLDADNDWGDGDVTASVTAWIETDADTTTVDSLSTKTEVINFYDPKDVAAISTVERVVGTLGSGAAITGLNQHGDAFITGSLRFSRVVNLDQVDLTQWKYQVDSTESGDDLAVEAIDVLANGETLGNGATANNGNIDLVTPAGYLSSNKSAFGRLLFKGKVKSDLNAGDTYKVGFSHGDGAATTILYESPGFQVSNTAATAKAIESAATDTNDISISNEAVSVRTGTKTVTYTAQITAGDVNGNGSADAGDDAVLKTANVPVLAVVTAGAVLPTGDKLTVSGTATQIDRPNAVVITSGLTDADGKWTVTVSSTVGTAGQSYTVAFYVLLAADTWSNARKQGDASSTLTATYAAPAAGASTFTASSSVLNGANPEITFYVKDQFGAPMSASSTGRAYSVELKAPVRTNLELFGAVVDGKVTFTFKNYLPASQSDVLTAKLFTGSSTSPSYVSGVSSTITLYNSVNAASVVVAKEVTGVVVTYDDFITGTANTTTNIAPDDNSFVYSGSVVDASGAGIPGAPVTIEAPGFQFQVTGGDYFKDKITVAATSAGTFSVNVWTHTASATGISMKVTSGSLSGTTLVKSAIRSTLLSAADLSFTWTVPTETVVNTTYAVTAKVTDKWGNPVQGAKVRFNGFGAALFNGKDTDVDKITDRTGSSVVYLRSLKDVDGLSAIGAKLVSVATADGAPSNVADLATVFTDVKTTAWDESKWTDTLSKEITFLKSGSGATGAGKVNVGSFNGKLVVYASGLNGARISWKVGGNWGSQVAASNYAIFNRPTPRAGVTVSVEIYVNGVLTLTKSVLTR